ncbi:MAG TPA: hypothetical protein VMF06_07380 [Candidatus Limnocylindria bacterium]|nr:hypothetical protein [Candidatus Limnocylindria bacterium]
MESHPGNIFVQGEPVHLEIGRTESNWSLYDYYGQEQERGTASRGLVRLGPLPVGWYELRSESRTNWLGVVGTPPAEVSSTSPVALDLALAWRVAPSNWTAVVNLARLAGASWVRDRIGWGELETAPHWFANHTRYDDAIRAASKAGLNVLEVNHQAPEWAGTNTSRFPEDLRPVFDFYKYVAARWKGVVKAVEPWNEADIEVFGGHLGSEIATFQKAAWFGLKAGNPDVVVCQNVFAVAQANILTDFVANDAVAYYETFNLHHYVAPSSYPDLYRQFRSVSQGRPLWTTEANWPLHWSVAGSDELSRDDLREQAERVAKVLGSTLVEGASHTFYFVLPHYSEGATQFGLLRPDLSPRPAYVAFAAAGRMLANARPIGSISVGNGGRVLAFRVRFEGRDRDLIIAWSGAAGAAWKLPATPLSLFDHLGRRLNAPQLVRATELTLSKAPVFALFPSGDLKDVKWVAPPANPLAASVVPCPVVLQAVWPGADCIRSRSALRLPGDRRGEVPIYAYNFGDRPATGTLRIPPHSPVVLGLRENGSTEANFEIPITVSPGQRVPLALVLDGRHPGLDWFNQPVRIEGDFGSQGHSKLSINIAPDPNVLAMRGKQYLLGANQPSNWQLSSSGNGRVSVTERKDGSLQFNASPKTGNRFVFPRYPLLENERPDDSVVGVVVSLTPVAGSGTWSIIVEEANGSNYLAPLKPQPRPGQTVETVAWLEDASWGSTWSVFDDNNKLDTRLIRAIRIGCNTQDKDIKFAVQNIRWLKR